MNKCLKVVYFCFFCFVSFPYSIIFPESIPAPEKEVFKIVSGKGCQGNNHNMNLFQCHLVKKKHHHPAKSSQQVAIKPISGWNVFYYSWSYRSLGISSGSYGQLGSEDMTFLHKALPSYIPDAGFNYQDSINFGTFAQTFYFPCLLLKVG